MIAEPSLRSLNVGLHPQDSRAKPSTGHKLNTPGGAMGYLYVGTLDLEIKRLSMLVYKWLLGSNVYNDKRLASRIMKSPTTQRKRPRGKAGKTKPLQTDITDGECT